MKTENITPKTIESSGKIVIPTIFLIMLPKIIKETGAAIEEILKVFFN